MNNKLNAELTKAKQYFSNKQFEKALAVLNNAKQSYPYSRIINDSILQLYMALGQTNAAIGFILELQNLDDYSNEYDNMLADMYYQTKQFELALQILLKQLDKDQNNALLNYKSALIAKELGDLPHALSLFKNSLDKGFDKKVACYAELAEILKEQRQESKAFVYLQKIIQLQPENINAKYEIASYYLSLGEKEKAIQLYQEIIHQDPQMILAMVRLTYALKIDVSNQSLISGLKRRLRGSQTSQLDKESLCYALGKAHDDLKDYQQALDFYRKANQFNKQRIGAFNKTLFIEKINLIKEFVNKNICQDIINTNDNKYVFIIGHFRSGSTLVEQIISSHSGITSVGEVGFFMNQLWMNDNLDGLLNSSDCIEQLRKDYQQTIKEMVDYNTIIIDKRPENIIFIGLIKILFPNAKFIHTKRDFADNALSIYFQNLNNLSTFATDFKSISEYDYLSNEIMLYWEKSFASSIHTVFYEDVVNDYEKETRGLLEFVGVEFEDACLNFNENKNFVRTASTVQVRNKIYNTSTGRINNYLEFLAEEEQKILTNKTPF